MTITDWQELVERIDQAMGLIRIDRKQLQLDQLQAQIAAPEFWNDPQTAQRISQTAATLQQEIEQWQRLNTAAHDHLELAQLGDPDPALQADLDAVFEQLTADYKALETTILLSGEYDDRSALVSIHAGAGGVDAQDWAQMLLRMITRFAEIKQWTVTTLTVSQGQEAGIKSVTIEVGGAYAYGMLQSEHGVHRLVRVSPFDAEGMRHTSFASMEVIPDLGDVAEADIPEADLRIDVFRAGGNGGQSVNTTDSAVRIVHIPTGTTVSCQNEKSQHQNKAAAMKILKSKLYQLQLQERAAAESAVKGEYKSAEWGNQIRSYVLHPYKLVKDHRTNYETKDPDAVLNGELEPFVQAYLKWKTKG